MAHCLIGQRNDSRDDSTLSRDLQLVAKLLAMRPRNIDHAMLPGSCCGNLVLAYGWPAHGRCEVPSPTGPDQPPAVQQHAGRRGLNCWLPQPAAAARVGSPQTTPPDKERRVRTSHPNTATRCCVHPVNGRASLAAEADLWQFYGRRGAVGGCAPHSHTPCPCQSSTHLHACWLTS